MEKDNESSFEKNVIASLGRRAIFFSPICDKYTHTTDALIKVMQKTEFPVAIGRRENHFPS